MYRLRKALAIGFITGVLGALTSLTPFGASLERNQGLNFLFNFRGPLSPPSEVAIIAIDTRTGLNLDLPQRPKDWPRTIHVHLIDALVKKGAKAIIFDLHFFKPKSAAQDQQLAEAVKNAGNVVLVEQVNGKRQPISDETGKIVGTVWAEELLQPFPVLADSARGLATFTLPKNEAKVHGFLVFKESVGQAPTLPAVALHLALSTQTRPGLHSDGRNAEQLSQIMKSLRTYYSGNTNPVPPEQDALNGALHPALINMYQGSAFQYLNFYGPPGSIPTIPYHAVIKGFDPNLSEHQLDVAGKTVFVGYSDLYDPGQPDRFYTVFTNEHGVDLSGVEIAATAFANLYHQQSLQLPHWYWPPLGLLLFGLICGALSYVLPAFYGIPLILLLSASYLTGAIYAFNQHYLWLPLIIPLMITLPFSVLLGLFAQYHLERKRSQHFSETLNYYLPEHVAHELTANNASADAFNRVVHATCLATDMAGFSRIAEQMAPNALAAMLNDYFDTLAAPLKKYGVSVTEFRADAIMCAWVADNPNKELQINPILAALEAANAMHSFKQKYNLYNTDLRIGLETGEVYIGHAGGGGHFVYSIVGDCANTASRIEGLNKHIGTKILATASVIDGMDDVLCRYIGHFMFVNKTEANPIYEIIAPLSTATDEQHALCDAFASAVQTFQQGQWKPAATKFMDILTHFPDDGPSQFFLQRALSYQDVNNQPEDPKIIRMDAK